MPRQLQKHGSRGTSLTSEEPKNKLVAPWVSSVAEQTVGCLLDFHFWKSSADFTGSQAMSVLQQRSETIEPFFFNVAWFLIHLTKMTTSTRVNLHASALTSPLSKMRVSAGLDLASVARELVLF